MQTGATYAGLKRVIPQMQLHMMPLEMALDLSLRK